MYQINRPTNRLTPMRKCTFSELGFREREHLQEWIVKTPRVFGEPLLFIQKEFSGFDGTRERLDLLALDKAGNLVLIENKLDDSGRDVVWQALKYVSYCAQLTTDEIIHMFQDYLDIWHNGADAKAQIEAFLDFEGEELILNEGDQRVILVANQFRKEVTSTVLWLLDHDIQVQCFRATPYALDEEVFLQMEQIIPLPETAEYTIGLQSKAQDEKQRKKVVSDSLQKAQQLWHALKEDLLAHNITHLDGVTVLPRYYIGFSFAGARFHYCLGRNSCRVEWYLANDPDQLHIDAMLQHQDAIEKVFGDAITFQRLPEKRASRIRYDISSEELVALNASFQNEAQWPQLIQWFRETMERFVHAVGPVWEGVKG